MAAEKKKTGRPKTGTTKKNEPAEAYLVKYPHLLNDHYTIDQINAYADAALDYFRSNPNEILISRYFTINNVPKRSYSRFSEKSEYFSFIWSIIKEEQKERLAGKLPERDNSTAGLIFIMKNVTDWRDQPETETDADHEMTFTGFNDKAD